MNQLLHLLEARAVAREREHQLAPHPRAPRRRLSLRRSAPPSPGRRAARAARATHAAGGRPSQALAARG